MALGLAVIGRRGRRGVRHQLSAVVTAVVCAVVAGYRSYTATAEGVADVPDATVQALGITPDRRPSEATIRRLLQSLDPDPHPEDPHRLHRHRLPERRPGRPDPTSPTTARRAETLHHRDRLRHHRSAGPSDQTGAAGRVDPRTPVDREQIHWVRDVTYDDDLSQIRTGNNRSWQRYATPLSAPYASPASPPSPPPTAITPVKAPAHRHSSASPDDFAGTLLRSVDLSRGRPEGHPPKNMRDQRTISHAPKS